MKAWIKFILTLLICILMVGFVYVWRFGWPKWENKEAKVLQNIYDNLAVNLSGETDKDEISVALSDTKILFTKKAEKPETVIFSFDKALFTAIAIEKETDMAFFEETISRLFQEVAVYNGYSRDNARYSLTKDILKGKTLDEDGYQYTSVNGVTRFMVSTNKKLNLADKQEVYIKEDDLKNIADVLKNKLQYKLIEKAGIALEKNVSYARNLVFVIYEQEELTNRTYNSLMSLLKTLTGDDTLIQYIKANYPVITREGTITLNGISISLNEGLGDGNVHYYEMPKDYEYMLIKINVDKYVIE